MESILEAYNTTMFALGAFALLMLIQVVVADVQGIKARHVPGTPVEPNHGNSLFRASRVVANTNESAAIFILLAIYAIGLGASPAWTGYLSIGYVVMRAIYAVFYYLNQPTLRSVSFAVSLLLLAALFGVGTFA